MREDLQHPDVTQIRKTGYPARQPENTNIQEHDTTRKDVEQMMLDEILDEGGKINIYFFEKDKQAAKRKIEPFKRLGDIENAENRGLNEDNNWLIVYNELVSVTAFYGKENNR